MSCHKHEDFRHGDKVILNDNSVGIVLGLTCDGHVIVRANMELLKLHPSTLTIIGHTDTDEPEIECLTCYKIREQVAWFVRFWLPPIAVGIALGTIGQVILG